MKKHPNQSPSPNASCRHSNGATGPMSKAVVKAGKPLVYVNRKASNLPKGVAYSGSKENYKSFMKS